MYNFQLRINPPSSPSGNPWKSKLTLQRPISYVHCAAPPTIPANEAAPACIMPSNPVILAEVAQANHGPASVNAQYNVDWIHAAGEPAIG